MRTLGLCLFLLLLAGPARAADVVNDRADAAAALNALAELAEQEAAALTADLARDDVYLFWVNDEAARITDSQLEQLFNYMQLQYLLDPGSMDRIIKTAAKLMEMPEGAVRALLGQSPDSLLVEGALFTARSKLRAEADKHRAAIQQHIKELNQLAEAARKQAKEVVSKPTWPPPDELQPQTVITPVEDGGMTVDYCLTFGASCGQPVADEFCRRKGFTHAVGFTWQYMHPTRTLGSGELCDASYCGGMTTVVCE
jgi:hypothetical protein